MSTPLHEARREAIAEERRRMMRDLHDGAQQSLLALATRIALAESLVNDPVEMRLLLGEARRDLAHAMAAIRAAVSGDAPPSLASGGLRAALAVCARQARVPIEVRCTDERYPQRVETCVYFCCAEAMQNLTKHAEANRGNVRVVRDGGGVRFEVSDDGKGFDPGRCAGGRGLQNLRDRVHALGGELSLSSIRGAGTTVAGWLPLTGTGRFHGAAGGLPAAVERPSGSSSALLVGHDRGLRGR